MTTTTATQARTSAATSFWIVVFELCKTVLWFSRAWVAGPANWIVNNKMTPQGYKPDWGINSFQYLFLPILPIVTLTVCFSFYAATLYLTKDVYLASGLLAFGYLYMSGGIHMDGYVDTIDAVSCHDKDKWEVMKEPTIGGLGAYNLNLYQMFFTALVFYVGVLAQDNLILFPYLVMSFVMARINLLYVVTKYHAKGLFRADEIVNLTPPYLSKAADWVFDRNTKYWFGLTVLALVGYVATRLGTPTLASLLTHVALTIAVIVAVNQTALKRVTDNLGFISGDVFGWTISLVELISIFVLLFSYKAGWV